MSRHLVHHFPGQRAVVLHRSRDVCTRLAGRLDALGLRVEARLEALEPADATADFLILDVDQAHDAQFPWPQGQAPMPAIGLVGSESPGRLAWALERGIDAFLPLTAAANLYSALVIAHARFQEKLETRRREAETARRAGQRLDLIRAVLALMDERGVDEAVALKQLRAFAMVERIPLEDAAERYLAEQPARRKGLR